MSREKIVSSLTKGVRLDGRKLDEFRDVLVEYGISKGAEGSARVKIGETEVLAGVKLEIGEPYPDTPDKGSLMVGAEFLPIASPDFEVGPPSIEAIELARIVDRGIREGHAIDLNKLCIKEKEHSWIVVIDICTINDAGNLIDASSLAAAAALKDTKLPEYDKDFKIDYKKKTNKKLPLHELPVEITVYKTGDNFFVDPITDEEEFYDARLTVAVLDKDNLCALQKGGDYALSTEDIAKMVDLAIKKAAELKSKL